MTYCVISDVEGINSKRTYDNTNKPTITQVNGMISRVASMIDAAILGMGLSIPTTADPYLVTMNAFGAAGLAEASLLMAGTSENAEPRDWRWNEFKSMLKAFKENPAIAGFDVSNAGGGSLSNVTEGMSNNSLSITIDGESW
jgi:hypothetical protein